MLKPLPALFKQGEHMNYVNCIKCPAKMSAMWAMEGYFYCFSCGVVFSKEEHEEWNFFTLLDEDKKGE
jgi:hypothetical protein